MIGLFLKMLMDFMDNPHQKDEFGNTVLHHVILNDSSIIRNDLVKLLTRIKVKSEFDFDKLKIIDNNEGNDCLHIACEKGHVKVVDTIMRMGHSAGAVNMERMNALHVAVKEKHLMCVRVILSYTEKDKKDEVIKARNIHDEDTIMIGIKKRQKAIVDELLTTYSQLN